MLYFFRKKFFIYFLYLVSTLHGKNYKTAPVCCIVRLPCKVGRVLLYTLLYTV